MAENNWKSPAAIISFITALVAVGGLFMQYKNFEIEKQKLQSQIDVQIEQIRDLQTITDNKNRLKQNLLDDYDEKINKLQAQLDSNTTDNKRASSGINLYGKLMNDPQLSDKEQQENKIKFDILHNLFNTTQAKNKILIEKKELLEKEKREFIKSM